MSITQNTESSTSERTSKNGTFEIQNICEETLKNYKVYNINKNNMCLIKIIYAYLSLFIEKSYLGRRYIHYSVWRLHIVL